MAPVGAMLCCEHGNILWDDLHSVIWSRPRSFWWSSAFFTSFLSNSINPSKSIYLGPRHGRALWLDYCCWRHLEIFGFIVVTETHRRQHWVNLRIRPTLAIRNCAPHGGGVIHAICVCLSTETRWHIFQCAVFHRRNHLVVWWTSVEGNFNHDAGDLHRVHWIIPDDFECAIAPRQCITLLWFQRVGVEIKRKAARDLIRNDW